MRKGILSEIPREWLWKIPSAVSSHLSEGLVSYRKVDLEESQKHWESLFKKGLGQILMPSFGVGEALNLLFINKCSDWFWEILSKHSLWFGFWHLNILFLSHSPPICVFQSPDRFNYLSWKPELFNNVGYFISYSLYFNWKIVRSYIAIFLFVFNVLFSADLDLTETRGKENLCVAEKHPLAAAVLWKINQD